MIMKQFYRSFTRVASVFLLVVGVAVSAFAQERLLTGRITDSKDAPMPGVNVIKKGTTVGTTSDVDGNFSIQVQSSDILVFSFIGYSTQEVAVGNQTAV